MGWEQLPAVLWGWGEDGAKLHTHVLTEVNSPNSPVSTTFALLLQTSLLFILRFWE